MASSAYQPLADYLAHKKGDVWDAAFSEIEEKLGRPLPQSAYRHQAWWANQSGPGHSQTHGWRSAGWRTSKLDLEQKRVRFERERPLNARQAGKEARSQFDGIDEELVRRAMSISENHDRADVINSALREYVKQEAIRAVVAMGGSSPGFKAAPRERPWS